MVSASVLRHCVQRANVSNLNVTPFLGAVVYVYIVVIANKVFYMGSAKCTT